MAASTRPEADLVVVLRFYVDKMLRDVPGMKVLLLDQETTKVVSTVYSQSDILEQEVYLVEKLDVEKGDQLFHMKASGCAGHWRGLCCYCTSSSDVDAGQQWATLRAVLQNAGLQLHAHL
jgi:hypothetical protein